MKNIFRIQRQLIRLYSNKCLETAQRQQQQKSHKSTAIHEPVKHAPYVGQQFSANDLSVRFATPQQLQPKPDNVENLEFGTIYTDHILKIYYHKKLGGWQRPEIMPLEDSPLSLTSKFVNYAVQAFEGMKAYRGVDDKIRIFRPHMNMNRLNLAARRLGLPTFEGEQFLQCLSRLISIDSKWVPHTEAASLYIRPLILGIDPTLGIGRCNSALLCSFLSPVSSYFKKNNTGAVSLFADPQYTRASPGGVGNFKLGANYGPTIEVHELALEKGLQQVLWLYGEDHQVTEVGTMNIFMFYVNDQGEKELITPPLSDIILPGITRNSILTLTRQWGKFKVSESVFTMPQVCELLNQGRLLELFGTGTACGVSPVNRVNYMGQDLFIPTMEQEKPVHETIRKSLMDIQYGKVDHSWAVVID